jgi:unsaturated rhamnogalacturonyl hydrolase
MPSPPAGNVGTARGSATTAALPEPADVARLVAPTLTGLRYDTWNFGDSVGFEAMLAAADLLDEQRWSYFGWGWARAWASRSTPFVRQDCTAPGLAITALAQRFGDGVLLDAAVALARFLMSRPVLRGVYQTSVQAPLQQPCGPAQLDPAGAAMLADPPAGVFVDCLHFDPPFFAALAAATGDLAFADAALTQACGYLTALGRPDGLFDHFLLQGIDGRFGRGWGRGQGWAMLGLLDVVEQLAPLVGLLSDDQNAALTRIGAAAAALVTAMVRLQRPDGHWPIVITDPTSGDESSTAAFMAAGFHRALQLRIVTGPGVERAATAAYAAMWSAVDDTGTLTGVSAAVNACTDDSHYAHVPTGFRVPWGQGPVLLAAAARAGWLERVDGQIATR